MQPMVQRKIRPHELAPSRFAYVPDPETAAVTCGTTGGTNLGMGSELLIDSGECRLGFGLSHARLRDGCHHCTSIRSSST
jgi:hypothetical protein